MRRGPLEWVNVVFKTKLEAQSTIDGINGQPPFGLRAKMSKPKKERLMQRQLEMESYEETLRKNEVRDRITELSNF